MKQCISKVIALITKLWRTLKAYVRKKQIIRKADTDGDGKAEIIVDLNGYPSGNSKDSESLEGGK